MKEYQILTDIPEVTFNVMGVSEDEAKDLADQLLSTCQVKVRQVDETIHENKNMQQVTACVDCGVNEAWPEYLCAKCR